MTRNRLAMAGIAVLLVLMTFAGCQGGGASQSEVASLRLEKEALATRLEGAQRDLAAQEVLLQSFRQVAEASVGDRVVLTEGEYTMLPKTIAEAEAHGYVLMDTLDEDGTVIQAACFTHGNALHYGKPNPTVTQGVEWHGSTVLLIYGSDSEQLMGMVLESVSPQSSPPWEHHPEGHPGMDFPHWSMHIWFTEPPANLSLGHEH